MKTYKKALLVILSLVGCAVIIALPFGIRIIQEEGWEGVWKRKRATTNAVMPEATLIVDGAELKAKEIGLR